MQPFTLRRAPNRALISAMALVVLALALALTASSANASENTYSGRNLPGYSWTAGNGVVQPAVYFERGQGFTTSTVCVGPVTHDASGYHFPYGWGCQIGTAEISWPPIQAADGFYNPNPGTLANFAVLGLSN